MVNIDHGRGLTAKGRAGAGAILDENVSKGGTTLCCGGDIRELILWNKSIYFVDYRPYKMEGVHHLMESGG